MKDVETIKLLDGSVWDISELLKSMEDDKFYYDVCGKNMLSSSIAKTLLHSYKKFAKELKYGIKETPALRDGWLFHTAILEPHVFEAQQFIDIKGRNTKAFKEAEEEYGKCFTYAEKKSAERLADGFLMNSKLVSVLKGAQFEVPIAGKIMGLPFRGKADIITETGQIIDLKTTINIKKTKWAFYDFSYDLQCYIYCTLFGITYKDFKFIAIDKGTLVPKWIDVSEEFYLSGEEKCERAVKEYNDHKNTDLNEYLLWEEI
jgi:hypothetical protein